MFRFVVLTLTVSCVYASGYGGAVGGLGLADTGLNGGLIGGLGLGVAHEAVGLGGCVNGACGLGLKSGYGAVGLAAPVALAAPAYHHVGIIPAAIQSTRTYEVVPVALNYEAPVPQTIDVPANIQPINMIFRTASSPLLIDQIHTPAVGQHESTRSEDEPSVLTHESYKPVIQKYAEVIQPFREIEQKVLPVEEHVRTVVAKGEEYHAPLPLALPAPAYGGGLGLAGGLAVGNGY